MRRPRIASLLGVCLAVAACTAAPVPTPTAAPSGACVEDLPPRTSPTDYPVAVLHANGEDLPPVVGDVEWFGGDQPVTAIPARAAHLERFTVLQVQGTSEVSLRMSDGVAIDAWSVDAFPAGSFRAGGAEIGAAWSSGTERTNFICVPIRDGEWAIRADLTFAEGGGRGTYYWRLNVDEAPRS